LNLHQANPWRHALVALGLALVVIGARASDRPYLATNSAAAEEDDDNVWSIESWFARSGPQRAFNIAPEYAFNPTTSLQFEFTALRDRDAGTRGQQFELEFKHLFNHIKRDGYGWGAVLALGFEHENGNAWRRGGVSAKLPFTLALWQGEGALHLNAGVDKARGDKREWLASVALEREVFKRTTLFAEAVREGETKLIHAGLRWWAKRERIAIDMSALRERGGGERRSGFVLGVGFYDL
jgi:hypothetical protein